MNNTEDQLQESRFSSTTYFTIIFVTGLAGIAISAYLTISHYRNFADLQYQSFCAISRSLNCDTVAQSPFAIFMGVPIAAWGVMGHLFFLTSMFFFKSGEKRFEGLGVLVILSVLFSLCSVFLALVSQFYIRSYCIMCIAVYAINLILLLITWMAGKRFGFGSFVKNLNEDIRLINRKRGRGIAIAIGFAVLTSMAIAFYPNYWHYRPLPNDPSVKTGTNDDGNPWIGAEEPVLTIVEFTDYMCFQCSKMHRHLRGLVSEHPDKIRLVHRHFPLDHRSNPLIKEPVHEKSGLLSLLAVYAHEQNKFWQINDILFREARERKKFNFKAICEEAGLDLKKFQKALKDSSLFYQLAADIQTAASHGVTATPSFLINGSIYSGIIPKDVLSPVIE